MKWMFRLVGPIALCGALALSGACGKKQGPPARPPALVRTAVAVRMDTPLVIKAFGNTDGRESVDVVPQVSGMLVRTFVRDGEAVTNGQPLFQIDSSDYAARVRQVEGMVAVDRANLDLSRTTLERNRPLLEKQLLSQEAFDTLKTRVDAVSAQLRMDEAALEQARLNLARCSIAAPIAGICSRRNVDTGNLVAAGVTRLTNIRSYDQINLDFSVSEQYLGVLRQAMAEGNVSLDVAADGETNRFAGTLTFIDNAVNPLTGTITLRGIVPNPDLKLWARQFVNIWVCAGVVRDAVMVPEAAIQFGKMGPYLYVVSKDNQAAMRVVKLGVRHDGLVQVTEGVGAGDRVVTLGHLMLGPGAPVMEAGQVPQGGAATAAKPMANGPAGK
jgi:RND family efflux transporter MFP subunit